MIFLDELLLVLGLSMDGFAASVCLGMELGRRRVAPIVLLITGCHIGMLLAGYGLGAGVRGLFSGVFPWVAAALLVFLGANMLRTAGQEEPARCGGGIGAIAALAFATSLDAMTVGVALALMEAPPGEAAALTAIVMGALSLFGAAFGGRVEQKYRRASRIAGGVILTILGFKTLLDALGVF